MALLETRDTVVLTSTRAVRGPFPWISHSLLCAHAQPAKSKARPSPQVEGLLCPWSHLRILRSTGLLPHGSCHRGPCAQPKAVVVIVVISRDTAVSLRHSRVDVTRARLPDSESDHLGQVRVRSRVRVINTRIKIWDHS